MKSTANGDGKHVEQVGKEVGATMQFAIIVPQLTLFYEDGQLVEIRCGDDKYVKAER